MYTIRAIIDLEVNLKLPVALDSMTHKVPQYHKTLKLTKVLQ